MNTSPELPLQGSHRVQTFLTKTHEEQQKYLRRQQRTEKGRAEICCLQRALQMAQRDHIAHKMPAVRPAIRQEPLPPTTSHTPASHGEGCICPSCRSYHQLRQRVSSSLDHLASRRQSPSPQHAAIASPQPIKTTTEVILELLKQQQEDAKEERKLRQAELEAQKEIRLKELEAQKEQRLNDRHEMRQFIKSLMPANKESTVDNSVPPPRKMGEEQTIEEYLHTFQENMRARGTDKSKWHVILKQNLNRKYLAQLTTMEETTRDNWDALRCELL